MEEITEKIIIETKAAIANCAMKVRKLMATETGVKELRDAAQLCIVIVNVCERLQGLEMGKRRNPYLGIDVDEVEAE